jgi:hypothetical protein
MYMMQDSGSSVIRVTEAFIQRLVYLLLLLLLLQQQQQQQQTLSHHPPVYLMRDMVSGVLGVPAMPATGTSTDGCSELMLGIH